MYIPTPNESFTGVVSVVKIDLLSANPHLSLNHTKALGSHQLGSLLNINLIIPACKVVLFIVPSTNSQITESCRY